MKKLFFLLLSSLAVQVAAAQIITATGIVKDAGGNALHYAFVQDKQYKNGTYTDSLGNFTIQTRLKAVLAINCTGYKDTLVNVNDNNPITIVLHVTGTDAINSANAGTTTQDNTALVRTTLRDQINTNTNTMPMMQQGAIMANIHTKDATQGSRLFFKDWVHGYIINSGDTLVQNSGFLLNYDKMGGNLVLTHDKVSAIAVFKDKVKSFTLFDANNEPHTFTIIPEIDKTHYVQVIAAGDNYKIYKLTKTKFIESNYSSDGVASTGNNYDEYADEDTYYVMSKNGPPQKIALKKKSLKEAFNGDPAKLNKYFQANDGDIDDNYLKELGDFMNK